MHVSKDGKKYIVTRWIMSWMLFAYGGLDGGLGGDGEGDGEGGGEGGGWGQPRKALATPSPNAVSRPSDSL